MAGRSYPVSLLSVVVLISMASRNFPLSVVVLLHNDFDVVHLLVMFVLLRVFKSYCQKRRSSSSVFFESLNEGAVIWHHSYVTAQFDLERYLFCV